MQKEQVLYYLSKHKDDYVDDGVKILGLFGSYATNVQSDTSDIDILIQTDALFLSKHRGFHAFAKLEEIRSKLSKDLQKRVDIVDKTGLMQHKNAYIIKNTHYV